MDNLISKTRIKMLSRRYETAAFYALLSYKIPIKYDQSIPTACTNGKIILINRDYFLGLNEEERIFLLFHETLHIALKHIFRRENRDPIKWNVATDYFINNALVKYGLTMPEGGLYDSYYAGYSSEKIYDLLPESYNILPDHFDLIEEEELSVEDEQELEEILVQTKIENEIMGGYVPRELNRFFEELLKPKLNWKIVLRRFMSARVNSGYSFIRPNRRFDPEYLPSKLNNGLGRIDFLIDTSESITKYQFNSFISEVKSVLDEFKPKEIGFSQFDHMYRGTEIINSYTDIKKLNLIGGGGTEIKESLDVLNTFKTQAIVIITDGHILDLNEISSRIPLIWIVYNNPSFNINIGDVIHYEFN